MPLSYSYYGLEQQADTKPERGNYELQLQLDPTSWSAQNTGGSTLSYGYDPNGNLVSRNTSTNSRSYTRGVPSRLLKASDNTGVQGYYAYDGLGRRLEAKEGSSAIFYAYFGTEPLAEGATLPYTDCIYADGLRIARVTNAQINNPIPVYFHTDVLGSTRLGMGS